MNSSSDSPRLGRRSWRAVIACAALASAAPAGAHDTWFALRAVQPAGDIVMALGTGNQFPQHESAISPAYLRQHGCRQGGRMLALDAVTLTTTALVVRTKAAAGIAVTCWAQLTPFEIEIDADKVAIYLDEINASAALRQTWAAMQARGVRWKERYVKHARIEIAGSGLGVPADTAGAPALPVPMGMDVVLRDGPLRMRTGDTLSFQVLRDGAPLAGFALELRSAGQAPARWLASDADGRVSFNAPDAGRWVLRGTDLRLSNTLPDGWDSAFVTLAFEVAAPR